MALGFAGSVKIGFDMVQRLAQLLENDDPHGVWDPEVVAEWWPDDAATVFAGAPPEEQQLNSELILLSVHPNKHAGEVPWARSYVHCFRAPDFAPQEASTNEVVSIGSGSDVEPYVEAPGCGR